MRTTLQIGSNCAPFILNTFQNTTTKNNDRKAKVRKSFSSFLRSRVSFFFFFFLTLRELLLMKVWRMQRRTDPFVAFFLFV